MRPGTIAHYLKLLMRRSGPGTLRPDHELEIDGIQAEIAHEIIHSDEFKKAVHLIASEVFRQQLAKQPSKAKGGKK